MNCWVLSHLIYNNKSELNFIQRKIFIYYLKYAILKLNKNKLIYNFSLAKDRNIQDELNRNYRIIFTCLNDFFDKNNSNVMNRNLDEIIKEYKFF